MTLAEFRLSGRARKTLARIIPVVCPEDAAPLEEPILAEVQLMVSAIPDFMRLGFVVGLWLFEYGALLLAGAPFRFLSLSRRERYFRRWWDSRVGLFRQLAKNLSGLLNLGYYEQPVVRERMAYHPDRWIAEVAKKRLAAFADDIRRADEIVRAPDPLVPASSLSRRRPAEGASPGAGAGAARPDEHPVLEEDHHGAA